MKNSTGIILGVVVVILIIIGAVAYQKSDNQAYEQEQVTGGTLYVGITDATADISGVNEIDLSVNKVEVHSAASGWTTVSSNSKDYSLLALKASNKTELYAQEEMKAGTYDRVRVTLGDVVVKTKTKGDVQATTPGSQVVMNTSLNVRDGEVSHIKLDFMADKSLHSTSDGKYVFAPVVEVESRSNASVAVASDETVTVSGGMVDAKIMVGVDLAGSSRANFELKTDNTLKIDTATGNNLNFSLGGKSYTSNAVQVREEQMNTNGGALQVNY